MNKQYIVRHGEVILKQIDSLPKEAVLIETTKKKIVAFSETHHHHILEAIKPFKIYTWENETYVEIPELAELWHQKTGKDTHAPHKIMPAFYKIIIKKSYNYFSKAMEKVRD